MTTRVFIHIVNGLKKWLSRLTRSSARLLFFFLSLLRRGLAAKLSCPTVPQSQSDIVEENLSICSSFLPSWLELAVEHLSPSDDPYTGASRPLRGGTTVPSSSGNNATIEAYTSTAETDGAHLHSVSSSHLSLHASAGQSASTGRSLTRPIAVSEIRQAWRTHDGPVHSRPVNVCSSMPDLRHRTLGTASVPSDVPSQASAMSEVIIQYPAPPISRLVADEIRQYHSRRYQAR